MKKGLILLVLLACASVSHAATPTLVQYKSDSIMNQVAITKWPMHMPNPAIGGNTVVIACYWHGSGATSATFSVSDDKSDTWTLSPTTGSDSTQNSVLQIAYAQNVTAGMQKITPLLNSAFVMQCGLLGEFYNVSTASGTSNLDGASSCHVQTTSTTITAGSFSTSSDGDLILNAATIDNFTTVPTTPVTWTPSGSFVTIFADGTSLLYDQYEVQTTHGAINATGTVGHAQQGSISCAIAFKAASAGGAPAAGIHVNGTVIEAYNNTSSGGQINWSAGSITLQFPAIGNLIFVLPETLTADKPSAISSSPSLTWNKITGTGLTNGCADNTNNSTSECGWYASNPSPSNSMTITITYGGTPAVAPVTELVDMSGAATSAFDVAAGSTGNLAAETGTVTGPTISPTTTTGLIIAGIEQDGQTVSSMSHGYLMTVQCDGYQDLALDQDGGWGHWYSPPASSSGINWTYSNTEGANNVGNWEAIIVAFKASAAGGVVRHRGQVIQ